MRSQFQSRDRHSSAFAGGKISFQTAWKNCRSGLEEANFHEASVAGRPDEVARIDIMSQAAQQWQREVAVGGDQQCELRPTYGLRGVRVGEASNPGPVQTLDARRLVGGQRGQAAD